MGKNLVFDYDEGEFDFDPDLDPVLDPDLEEFGDIIFTNFINVFPKKKIKSICLKIVYFIS